MSLNIAKIRFLAGGNFNIKLLLQEKIGVLLRGTVSEKVKIANLKAFLAVFFKSKCTILIKIQTFTRYLLVFLFCCICGLRYC